MVFQTSFKLPTNCGLRASRRFGLKSCFSGGAMRVPQCGWCDADTVMRASSLACARASGRNPRRTGVAGRERSAARGNRAVDPWRLNTARERASGGQRRCLWKPPGTSSPDPIFLLRRIHAGPGQDTPARFCAAAWGELERVRKPSRLPSNPAACTVDLRRF